MILRILFSISLMIFASCTQNMTQHMQDGYMLHSVSPEISPYYYSGHYVEDQNKYQKKTMMILGKEWSYYSVLS